jgi:hemerythrin-like domain-containing protein
LNADAMQITPRDDTPPAAAEAVALEMLAACHRRVEDQCATLLRLAAHLRQHGADAQAGAAAAAVMRYFDSAARDHHADEETDLFPALRAAAAAEVGAPERVAALVSELIAQHRELEALWQRLRAVLEAVRAGTTASLDAAPLDAFLGRYAAHLAREDGELLPLAQRLLGSAERERIGAAMCARRGIALPV